MPGRKTAGPSGPNPHSRADHAGRTWFRRATGSMLCALGLGQTLAGSDCAPDESVVVRLAAAARSLRTAAGTVPIAASVR